MRHLGLITVITAACSLAIAGCEVDDSLPTHPRTASPFTADPKAQDNAEHRVLEAPGRAVPTGSGPEFPGQSKGPVAPGDAPVVMLDNLNPASVTAPAPAPAPDSDPNWKHWGGWPTQGWDQRGTYHNPTVEYNRDIYNEGPLPHLPPAPGTVPMVGSAQVPDADQSIDFSWGEVLQLQNYPHRDWPEVQGHYEVADARHNPVYYFHAQDFFTGTETTGTYAGDWINTAFEVPWFYLNTAILPKLMILEPPLAERTTQRAGSDPNYHGYLPADGPVVPTPAPGVLRWEYPFLNPDGSVKEKYEPQVQSTTQPATTP